MSERDEPGRIGERDAPRGPSEQRGSRVGERDDPGSMNEQGGGPGPAFDVLPVPIGRYAHHPAVPAVEAATEVADLLARLGGRHCPWVPADPIRDTTAVLRRLHEWSAPHAPRCSVLYWSGHGEALDGGAWLAVYNTDRHMRSGGIGPETFADHVLLEWRRRAPDPAAWMLVVIEACGAERFANLVASRLLGHEFTPERCAIIGVSEGAGTSFLGRFATVLAATIDAYTVNDPVLSLKDFVSALEDRLGDHGTVLSLKPHLAPPIPRPPRPLAPVVAPLDVYAELLRYVAELAPDERGHFLPKAQGADGLEQGEPAWHFVGRETERAAVASWLRSSEHGLLAVTGRAGSGKSALLGHILVHTTPRLRELLLRSGDLRPAPEGEFGAPGHEVRFDAVLHLTGTTVAHLVRRLADALGLGLPATGISAGSDVEWLLSALARRGGVCTILVDALDEAQEPITIAGSVLRRMAALPGVRIVVGTRASTREAVDAHTDDTDLLTALDAAGERVVVASDRRSVGAYVEQRLIAARARGRLAVDDATITAVARLVRDQDREFLYARLAVYELLAQPDLLAPDRAEALRDLLSRDHRALFATAVARLSARARTAHPLLEALAVARGRGLPRADRIWALVATALDDDRPVHEADIDDLLVAASPYIMLDTEHAQSVYRLAHRTFAEHFLTGPPG
ncbi:hypothetical protein [Embleya sp. NPDC050493]|uniref:hypothetical protein n=1 Tax=Embleya sp. NPDC050493 TaxID=3363989 RepID=UPI003799F63A